jgi:hypothetical protein
MLHIGQTCDYHYTYRARQPLKEKKTKMLNIVDTTQVAKLTPEHIMDLVVLATRAGVALPKDFINAIYTLIYEDPRSWEDVDAEFNCGELFAWLEWQDRLNCDCSAH